ncbi:DNA primase [bacterium]|nr:DNA primase [bacterium]NIN92987.1 DNA primase [bacterium]NIO19051.1 DNA primase [bacterium]NIO74179.1 DNA primase [bacterium]
MAIPGHLIDQIRQTNNIVEVISGYLPLKKTGSNFKALCPFHQEKTPSFIVSPQKEIFHCFGCGEGGNVFNFLMKHEKISFIEAVERLAERAGISLPKDRVGREEASRISQERKSLFEINRHAADFFHRCLKSSSSAQKAREYLKKRGLKEEIIDKFGLGYAPGSGKALLEAAVKKGYSKELLKKAGLVAFSEERNDYRDLFLDRIIFPISDVQSRIIAFGGRTLGERLPKYLNSPETGVFYKGKILYALNLAKESIQKKNQVIVLEGYTDVLTCHEFGVENSVATLGTALTRDHVSIISRYAEEVVIVYDADAAGVKATLRGLDLLIGSGLKVKVVALPQGSDPDDFLRSQGAEKFQREISQSHSLVDYRIKLVSQNYDLKSSEGKVAVVEEVLPTIARIENLIEQKEEIKKLSQLISVDEETLLLELGRINRKTYQWEEPSYREELARDFRDPTSQQGILKAEKGLVQVMLNFPEEIETIRVEVAPKDFLISDLSKIVKVIYELYDKKESINPAIIMDRVYSQDLQFSAEINQIIASLAIEEKKAEFLPGIVNALISKVKMHRPEQEYRKIGEEVAALIDRGLPVEAKKIEKFKKLTKELKGSRNERI